MCPLEGLLLRVAIYIRVSTEHDEQTSSLENQEGGALDAVQRNGWTIYDIYQERQSGLRLHKRKEFMRLMSDARERKFDVVWVKSLTRFGRKIADLHKYVEELVRLDIRFVAEIEGIDTLHNDWSTKLGMWSMFAQWESQGLSDRIRFALEVKAGRGEYMGSLPPFGYDVVDKTLVVSHDGSAETVRRIFSMYLKGVGPSSIANILSAEGIPTPLQRLSKSHGQAEWQESTVRKILSNPVYTGVTVSHKETTKVLGDTKRVSRSEAEWIVKEGTHPSLISPEDFDAVQRLMRSRSRKNPFRPHTHLLSNVLYCADCGSKMYCIERPWGRVHYVCGKYIKSRRRTCSRHTAYEDQLAVAVLQHLRQKALQSADVVQKSVMALQKKMTALEKKIAKILKRQARAQDLYLDGNMSRSQYHDIVERTEGQLRQLRQELSEQKESVHETLVLSDADRQRILQAETLDAELLLRYVKRIMIAVDGTVKTIDFRFSGPYM
jgi:site-specific DNA recombinase